MAYLYGKFVWFTLHSNDLDRAKAFYTELFGWGTEAMEMPDGVYTMFKNGEQSIGGMRKPPKDGLPSHWISYASVKNVDASAKKVADKGGKVLMDAFDIPNVGRCAPVTDPQGAAFILFKANDGDGDDAPTKDGGWHWNELWTNDASGALSFYKDLIGYSVDEMPMPQGAYNILKANDVPRGGLMQSPDDKVPPMWLGYVQVADADATAKRAKDLGGELIKEPDDVPGVGRFGILKDPTGAVVGFIKPAAK